MSFVRRSLCAAFCASLSLPTLLLSGCSDAGTSTLNSAQPALVSGNWQVSSSSANAKNIASFSGVFTTQAGKTTAIVHTQSANACVAPNASFELAGTPDEKGNIALTGPLGKGTLTLSGTVAPDGKSLTNATYNVTGGACALAQAVPASAQNFQPITGSYTGNFADADGNIATVAANFSQSTTPDANGNFTLAGTATVTNNNPCFPGALTLTNTQVTGGTFTYTLTPSGSTNGNSVVATGTFASDASTLSITSWTSSGTCGADTGVQSTMTRPAV
jgi:hypothetical protein